MQQAGGDATYKKDRACSLHLFWVRTLVLVNLMVFSPKKPAVKTFLVLFRVLSLEDSRDVVF